MAEQAEPQTEQDATAGAGGDPDEASMAEREAMADGETDKDPGAGAGAAVSQAIGDVPSIHLVDLDAYAILGTAMMPVSQLLRMGRGAVVELNTGLGDAIDLKVNDCLVARGEVVMVDDRIAVEITEIVMRDSA